ncbi:MAG: beta-lactamase family protein [Muribaculaceae bacterium]|nr:beta-lactamase family protein [Muribaculaceae bacterium]
MRTKIKIIMIIAMTLGCLMGASAERAKRSSIKTVNLKRVEERLDSVLQSHYNPQSPGAALLIAKNGKAIYDKGIGIADMATGEKIDGNTAFNIASISKQFTAIGALKMQEMGLINLNNSVASYFPKLKHDIWKKIKLRHLLSHSSGVPDARPRGDRNFMLTATDEQSVQYMKELKELHFEPGSNYEYINPTFDLFYFLVEMKTGMKFVDFQKKVSL